MVSSCRPLSSAGSSSAKNIGSDRAGGRLLWAWRTLGCTSRTGTDVFVDTVAFVDCCDPVDDTRRRRPPWLDSDGKGIVSKEPSRPFSERLPRRTFFDEPDATSTRLTDRLRPSRSNDRNDAIDIPSPSLLSESLLSERLRSESLPLWFWDASRWLRCWCSDGRRSFAVSRVWW